MRKRVAVLSQILIVAMSFIIFIIWFDKYEREIEKAYSKESELVAREIRDIEATSDQILTTVNSLLGNYNNRIITEKIDYSSTVFAHFINGYRIIDGFKGISHDSIVLRVVETEDNLFLRRISFLKDDRSYSEHFQLDDNGNPVVVDYWKNETIQKEDTSWLNNDQLYYNKIVFSEFRKSKILNEQVFEVAQLSSDKSGRVVALDVSLPYLANAIKRFKFLDSYLILCDHFDNIILLASGHNESFLLEPDVNLDNDKVEVKYFLDETLEKQYFPDLFVPFSHNRIRYIGKWTSIKIGDKTYKIGYLVAHDINLWKVIFALFLFLIAVLSPYYFIYQRKKTSEVTFSSPSETGNLPKMNELDQVYENLIRQFDDERIYLDPHCSVGMLSDRIGCDRSSLSKAVQHKQGKTLKELINDYRINDAAEFMKGNKNALSLSIDVIAEKFGYKSRSSFHREFNKRMNYSPFEYISLFSNSDLND